MSASTTRRVAIIGAGVAGLVAAKTLLARGFDCTLFERNARLGGVWAEGYVNFGVQVQRELYEFPDWPLDEDIPDFTPGAMVQAYLEGYARAFAVWPRIRFGTTVTAVARRPATGGWTLRYRRNGASEEANFDFLVVATGLYSNRPHLPRVPGRDDFAGEVLHASAVTDLAPLAGKRVVVVGFGKSASDIALEASAVAAHTSLIFRAVHWPVPAHLLDVLPFKWVMLNRLTSTLLPPYYRPSLLERCIHGPGRPLVWLWWRLVEGLLIAQYGLGGRAGRRASLVPDDPIELDAFGEAVMLPRPEFYRALRTNAIEAIHGSIARFTPTAVELADGTTRACEIVVYATGWEHEQDFFAEDVRAALEFADDGLYLYRQILHPAVPDLAFIGYAATIASVLTYNLQAHWLAEILCGRVRLPPAAAMSADIAELRAWKRRAMPFGRARAARLLLHMQHYHDQLLEDLGVLPWRKRGVFAPFKEVFAPYEPRDYRAIVAAADETAARPQWLCEPD